MNNSKNDSNNIENEDFTIKENDKNGNSTNSVTSNKTKPEEIPINYNIENGENYKAKPIYLEKMSYFI